MEKLETLQVALKNIINSNEDLDFPHFLSTLRNTLCISRKIVAQDLKIPYLKLFYLEVGGFCYMPDRTILEKLTQYYGLPKGLLREKVENYVEKGRKKCVA